MSRHRSVRFSPAVFLLAFACVWISHPLAAQDPKQPPASSQSAERMSKQTRLQVIRSLQSERVFARVMFPMGEKGLTLKDGQVSPSQAVISQQLAEFGPAVKPGDRCVITNVDIKDKEIVFDINGGNKKKAKWYQRIQVGGNGGTAPLPGTPAPQSLDAHGSSVTLVFDKYVPELSGDQVRAMLAPVFDFKALTAGEAYQKTLPPKLQAAIRDHKVLVGMDKEMVMYAKGRPNQRIRDKDQLGNDYEEWIYGTPPEEVEFVRFQGDEVSRLEIMGVDGKKEVRTAREIDMPAKGTEVAEQKPAPKPPDAPTLRRPGEQPEFPTAEASDHRTPRPEDRRGPDDGSPYPDDTGTSAPGQPGSPPHLTPSQ